MDALSLLAGRMVQPIYFGNDYSTTSFHEPRQATRKLVGPPEREMAFDRDVRGSSGLCRVAVPGALPRFEMGAIRTRSGETSDCGDCRRTFV